MLKGLDVFFYCSYKLSAKGYVFTKADIENNRTICLDEKNMSLLPKAVKKFFSTGGAEMAVSKYGADGKYYVIVKGIKNENKDRGVDELGRLVYVNIAFVSDSKETICKIASYIIMNYTKWCDYISSVVLPSPNDDAGYKIDCQTVSKLLEHIDNDNAKYENKKLKKYIDRINDFTSNYSFVVLSAGRDYFIDMFKIDGPNAPSNVCIDKKDFAELVQQTVVTGGAPFIPDIAEPPIVKPPIVKPPVVNNSDFAKVDNSEIVRKLEKQSKDLELILQQKQQENEKLKSELFILKNQKSNMSVSEEDSYKSKLQEAERRADRYENHAKKSEETIADLNNNIDELENKVKISESKLNESENKAKNLERKIKRLYNKLIIGGAIEAAIIVIVHLLAHFIK